MLNKTRLIHQMVWNEGEEDFFFLNWKSNQGDAEFGTCTYFLFIFFFKRRKAYGAFHLQNSWGKAPSAKRCPNTPAVETPKFTQSVFFSCWLGLTWLDVFHFLIYETYMLCALVPGLVYTETWARNCQVLLLRFKQDYTVS